MSQCIITGCALQLPNDGYVWGDLHEEGDCYVFNGSGPVHFGGDFAEGKVLIIWSDYYFERRNVFVVAKTQAKLNEKALDYIMGGPKHV